MADDPSSTGGDEPASTDEQKALATTNQPAAEPAAPSPYPMPQVAAGKAVQPYNGPDNGYTSYAPPPVNLGTDPKLARLIRDAAKAQEEVSEVIGEVAPKVTVIEEKLLGGTRKERSRRGGGGEQAAGNTQQPAAAEIFLRGSISVSE